MKKLFPYAITALLMTTAFIVVVINSFDTKPTIFNAYATVAGFTAELSGNEEVPPVQTAATGSAEFTAPELSRS